MRGQTFLIKQCYHCGIIRFKIGSSDSYFICDDCKNIRKKTEITKAEQTRMSREKKLKRILNGKMDTR